MKLMNAVVFQSTGKFAYEKRSLPKIFNSTDVLVRVEAASICGTDVHILDDPPGFQGEQGIILGHECVGKVVETGPDVIDLTVGDRVVLEPNLACGACRYCRMGKPNLCSNDRTLGVTTDGVFCDCFLAPERALYRIPNDMPADTAVFAEPLNCVMGALNKLHIHPGQTGLVLGGGPIGLYFLMLLKCCGAGKIIVSEPSEYRAGFAGQCGADAVVNPFRQNLSQTVSELTDGCGVDFTIDAVGELIGDALTCTRRAGEIVLFGQNTAKTEQIAQSAITRNELTVFGSYIGPHTMPATIRLLDTGMIPVERIATHRLPMREFGKGLEAMRRGEALKVILYPD